MMSKRGTKKAIDLISPVFSVGLSPILTHKSFVRLILCINLRSKKFAFNFMY